MPRGRQGVSRTGAEMNTKPYAGIVLAAAAAIGGLAMAGVASARPALAARPPAAHSNVVPVSGYSSCLPTPTRLMIPGGSIKLLPVSAASCKFRTVRTSTTSSVNVSGGYALISVNGRECRVYAKDKDAVSISVVSDGSNSYIEIMDRYGRTRRVVCG